MDARYAQNIAEERKKDAAELAAARAAYAQADNNNEAGEAWRIAHAGYVDALNRVYAAARASGEINGQITDEKRIELNQRVSREKEAAEFEALLQSTLSS